MMCYTVSICVTQCLFVLLSVTYGNVMLYFPNNFDVLQDTVLFLYNFFNQIGDSAAVAGKQ